MPTLYHYSPMLHLPPILCEGLSKGEIAQPNPHRHEEAVSLTMQTDPDRLWCWGQRQSEPWKTTVRYVCRIDDDDPRLEPACDTWRQLGALPKFRKLLDPCGQAKWWYFYRGTISADRFVVQLRGAEGYVTLTEIDRVVEAVNIERDKFDFVVPEGMPFALDLVPKDDAAMASWILGDMFPADRFALLAAGVARPSS